MRENLDIFLPTLFEEGEKVIVGRYLSLKYNRSVDRQRLKQNIKQVSIQFWTILYKTWKAALERGRKNFWTSKKFWTMSTQLIKLIKRLLAVILRFESTVTPKLVSLGCEAGKFATPP